MRPTLARCAHRVFDTGMKMAQRDWAARAGSTRQSEVLRDLVAERTIERMAFVTRRFDQVLDYGSHAGNLERVLVDASGEWSDDQAQHLKDCAVVRERIGHITMADTSVGMLYRDSDPQEFPFNQSTAPTLLRVQLPPPQLSELLPKTLAPELFDAVVLNLALHWTNDLPGVLSSIAGVLKPDGMFMALMLGGETLFELRTALQLAETERYGGMAPRTLPMVDVKDLSGLLAKAGFSMVTIDVEEVQMEFPDITAVMEHLQKTGESHAALARGGALSKDLMLAADSIYRAMHGEDGMLPATFRVVFMMGWKTGGDQPQPAKRGSGEVSLKDALAGGRVA